MGFNISQSQLESGQARFEASSAVAVKWQDSTISCFSTHMHAPHSEQYN